MLTCVHANRIDKYCVVFTPFPVFMFRLCIVAGFYTKAELKKETRLIVVHCNSVDDLNVMSLGVHVCRF